ncbi:MAG: DUF1738 domain-containing protein [Tissierellia bacterium]|nr:DUF1738 domain-containing protein [Tissierellia bacterium]
MAEKKNKLPKNHEALVERIIEDLKEGTVPWQKPWRSSGPPRNALSFHEYTSSNRAYLSMAMLFNGYSDPRFMTFNQMQDYNKNRAEIEQLKIPKGTKGHSISFTSVYSRELRRNLSPKEISEMSYMAFNQKVKERKLYHYLKWTTVFNTEQLEGEFLPLENILREKTNVDLSLIENVAKRMNLGLDISSSYDRAFYRATTDSVALPAPERFFEDVGFYRTAFHELAHATGHGTRLDRPLSGRSNIISYAKEELSAELASLFLSQEIDLPFREKDLNQSSAYLESWIIAIKENPEILHESAKIASGIFNYLINHVREIGREKYKPQGKEFLIENSFENDLEDDEMQN